MKDTEILDAFTVEGFRYPLERDRRFKVKGHRGEYKVTRLERFPDGAVEALCWWRSGPSGERAEWRTIALAGPNTSELSKIFRPTP
jgi:hypothetical protein